MYSLKSTWNTARINNIPFNIVHFYNISTILSIKVTFILEFRAHLSPNSTSYTSSLSSYVIVKIPVDG